VLAEIDIPTATIASAQSVVAEGPLVLAAPGDIDAAPIMQAVPLQLLAYYMGRANGTDPDRRGHLKANEGRFAASRKLTRRSLLGTGL
jgi:glucosamine 6-phosphate synthetase-like amidotransferase/phosphosugar isomerase protein